MEGQCFFHEDVKKFRDINLDSALNELGMLSTITKSRIDYLKEQELDCLKEKSKRKGSNNSHSSAPLCVVHMNSDFVTQRTTPEHCLLKNSTTVPDCHLSDDSLKPNVVFKNSRVTSKHKRLLKYAPYCLNRRILPLEKNTINLINEFYEFKADVRADDQASPPIISRQDSGNKSNPSSPVKSQNSLTPVGCSIFRSRSLDDLEISKLNNLNESCDIASHGEIDTMSQRISKLHVS